MDDTQLTPDQIAEKGQKIYEEKLKVILGERKGKEKVSGTVYI